MVGKTAEKAPSKRAIDLAVSNSIADDLIKLTEEKIRNQTGRPKRKIASLKAESEDSNRYTKHISTLQRIFLNEFTVSHEISPFPWSSRAREVPSASVRHAGAPRWVNEMSVA